MKKLPGGNQNSGAHSKNLGTEFKTSRQRNLKCSMPGRNENSGGQRIKIAAGGGIQSALHSASRKKSPWWKGDSKNLRTEFRQRNSKGSEFKILHAKFKSLLNRSEIHYKHIYLEKLGGKGETIFT